MKKILSVFLIGVLLVSFPAVSAQLAASNGENIDADPDPYQQWVQDWRGTKTQTDLSGKKCNSPVDAGTCNGNTVKTWLCGIRPEDVKQCTDLEDRYQDGLDSCYDQYSICSKPQFLNQYGEECGGTILEVCNNYVDYKKCEAEQDACEASLNSIKEQRDEACDYQYYWIDQGVRETCQGEDVCLEDKSALDAGQGSVEAFYAGCIKPLEGILPEHLDPSAQSDIKDCVQITEDIARYGEAYYYPICKDSRHMIRYICQGSAGLPIPQEIDCRNVEFSSGKTYTSCESNSDNTRGQCSKDEPIRAFEELLKDMKIIHDSPSLHRFVQELFSEEWDALRENKDVLGDAYNQLLKAQRNILDLKDAAYEYGPDVISNKLKEAADREYLEIWEIEVLSNARDYLRGVREYREERDQMIREQIQRQAEWESQQYWDSLSTLGKAGAYFDVIAEALANQLTTIPGSKIGTKEFDEGRFHERIDIAMGGLVFLPGSGDVADIASLPSFLQDERIGAGWKVVAVVSALLPILTVAWFKKSARAAKNVDVSPLKPRDFSNLGDFRHVLDDSTKAVSDVWKTKTVKEIDDIVKRTDIGNDAVKQIDAIKLTNLPESKKVSQMQDVLEGVHIQKAVDDFEKAVKTLDSSPLSIRQIDEAYDTMQKTLKMSGDAKKQLSKTYLNAMETKGIPVDNVVKLGPKEYYLPPWFGREILAKVFSSTTAENLAAGRTRGLHIPGFSAKLVESQRQKAFIAAKSLGKTNQEAQSIANTVAEIMSQKRAVVIIDGENRHLLSTLHHELGHRYTKAIEQGTTTYADLRKGDLDRIYDELTQDITGTISESFEGFALEAQRRGYSGPDAMRQELWANLIQYMNTGHTTYPGSIPKLAERLQNIEKVNPADAANLIVIKKRFNSYLDAVKNIVDNSEDILQRIPGAEIIQPEGFLRIK